MTQLLQARGWYGVFLRAEIMEPEMDGDGVILWHRLHIRLRPLIGWTSAEGGFQGLYYNETRGRLSTSTKLIDDDPGLFLGDVCEDETATIKAMLILSVLETADAAKALYEQRGKIELTESATTLLVKRQIPRPRLPKSGEE